eukprot:CAMPEP_0178393600 /NCGR_PEP_ID=MMETSP0689_2-20121128/12270_1 /TAXON_ID=160604 /ORGANISM="Amphidinium massartii, Strain CS-259" /LENGTH=253 /DNA_ID=CAMNT_0020014195 /DNA_START=23 /DNA_END=784 /DNA_ORIENTATION=+
MTMVLSRSCDADRSRQLQSSKTWNRKQSAGDIVDMCRLTVRRPFDSAGIAESELEDVLAANPPDWVKTIKRPASEPGSSRLMAQQSRLRTQCTLSATELRFKQQCLDNQGIDDFVGGSSLAEDSSMSMRPQTQESLLSRPTTRARRERALDFWPSGDGARIMNHICPQKTRPMSLSGPAHQGFHNSDWSKVDHIQRLRARYPALRASNNSSLGPMPQEFTMEEAAMNRNFGRSHGSQRMPKGVIQVGSQAVAL